MEEILSGVIIGLLVLYNFHRFGVLEDMHKKTLKQCDRLERIIRESKGE